MAGGTGELMKANSVLSTLMRWIFTLAAILTIILTAVILYQLYHVYIGGTWTSENIVLALVTANISATITLYGLLYNINGKLERHMGEHR